MKSFASIKVFFPRSLLNGIAIVFALLLVVAGYYWQQLNSPMNVTRAEIFEVPPGASLNQISNSLVSKGYLANPGLLINWARFTGRAGEIKAGEYELLETTSPRQLLSKMVAGEIKQYQLTLVEGWTLQQALQLIWDSPGISPSLQGVSATEIARSLKLEYAHAEGLFFPDTYYYSGGTSDTDILERAQIRLEDILQRLWRERAGALPYETPYEALIMASIIEKESSEASERGHIAGVFVRRLERGMRLQSDPTVIYGLAERYDGNITRSSLDEVTLYNTYRINGLPPTPIALAGRQSIEASLNPLPSEYLYFVAKGDGSHYFSNTLEQHNEAVRRFQKNVSN